MKRPTKPLIEDKPLIQTCFSRAVSSQSKWPDSVWRYDEETPGSRVSLGWKFQLPDGSCSLDTIHADLLEGFRVVWDGMLKHPDWYGKTLKIGSAPRYGVGARELFRWMVFRGLKSFGDLSAGVLSLYVLDLPILMTDSVRFYGNQFLNDDELEEDIAALPQNLDDSSDDSAEGVEIEKSGDEGAEDKFTYGQVATRISTLYFIYAQSKRLMERGLAPMPAVPFEGKDASKVTGTIAPYVIRRIPPLPDEVALKLLSSAIKWVECLSEDVISLQRLYLDTRAAALARGLSRSAAIGACNEAICAFEFSCLPDEREPWRPQISKQNAIHPDHGRTILGPTQVLRTLVQFVRDAAITVLMYLVGIRTSESCSLEGDDSPDTILPPCITSRPSKSGVLEMFFVRGLASKGRNKPEPEEWLIGCQPYGVSTYPLPVKALIVLQRLFQPWRKLSRINGLMMHFSQRKSLPWAAESVSNISTEALIRGAKYFVFSEVDLSDLPDISERGEDLTAYRKSKGLRIRPHQGRKTFAAYVLDTRTSLLPAVSDHFKHVGQEVTESAYYPSEARLREELDSVQVAETIAFFVEALRGRKMAGKMADAVERFFDSPEFRDATDFAEMEHRVTELVLFHDLRIYFSDHGNCLIRVNPKESQCRKATNSAGWNSVTPDFSVRSPGMCTGCGCYLVDGTHLPFWERRLTEQTSLYDRAVAAGYSSEYRVHFVRARQAENYVKYLKGQAV
ncbi:hypothetical protein [Burkholderia pseudomallei]|uniref:hypothetical protein n=1 Tax=Burkholderia pseudomallei TaxID=28450 RepID=UPI001AD773BF|nr:hypothetical protein [Burkholderia pseudomallei]MBO7825953.1 hypothetical protein [Burkholderia pseudomallei]